jgi:hypothetical protein
MLRKIPQNTALTVAAFLLARMPARAGAGSGKGMPLEETKRGTESCSPIRQMACEQAMKAV